MNGIDEGDVGVATDDFEEGPADLLEGLAETFAAVGGDEDDAVTGEEFRETGVLELEGLVNGGEQGVDDGIAGDEDGGGGYVFLEKVLTGPIGGSEVPVDETRSETTVDLLGEGGVFIEGAKTGFDVADRDLLVEGGESGGEGGGGVTLDDDGMRPEFAENGDEGGEGAGGNVGRGLSGLH